MQPPDLPPLFVATRTYRALQSAVDDGLSAILLFGRAGSGKTTLLHVLAESYRNQRPVLLIRSREIVDADDLLAKIWNWLSQLGVSGRLEDTGSMSLVDRIDEITVLLDEMPTRPLLLLDDWDELQDRDRTDRIYYSLTGRTNAQIVISSRRADPGVRRIDLRIETEPFTEDEIHQLLGGLRYGPADPSSAERIAWLSDGSPLIVRLMLEQALSGVDLSETLAHPDELNRMFEGLVRTWSALRDFPVAVAAAILRRPLTSAEVAQFGIDDTDFSSRLLVQESSGISLAHLSLRVPILNVAGIIPSVPPRLRDLRFGAEEAERDTLLKGNFIDLPGFQEVVSEGKRIVVGDRGSGKSAMFTHLMEEARAREDSFYVKIVPLAHPSDLLRKLEANGEQLATAEQFKAGWLTLFAYAAAILIRTMGKGALQRVSTDLVRNLSPDAPSVKGRLRQVFAWIGGSSIKINVWPITIEPKAGRSGLRRAVVDLPAFIRDASSHLADTGIQLLVPVDRVDEIHKYDRSLQEKAVQGLFLAESHLAQLSNISAIVFLRSDLFTNYDIQEKNKLISRRVVLKWSKAELLEFVVKRVLSNAQLGGLGTFLNRVPNFGLELAMSAIFPAEVEGLPIEEWLWRSMENGNGDVSARQIILLLTLATQAPGFAEDPVAIPIFPPGALRSAMDSLSESSFRELIDDFRVAPTFLANCRAGNLMRFEPDKIANLFDEEEGPRSVQVDLLCRLGFLKRVVTRVGRPSAEFVVPSLYTRSWEAEGHPS